MNTKNAIQHFYIITMNMNPKVEASFKQNLAFCLCGSIGLFAIMRNGIRMHRYSKNFKEVGGSLQKFRHNFDEIEAIKNKNIKQMAFLEAVFPNFPTKYFQNTQNHGKYRTNVAKFYEELQCDSGFDGALRHNGKEYPIYFEMNKPSIGFEIATNALKFDQKGIKFHRNQMIAVYGQLSYSKDEKRYRMKTKLLGLDSIEIIKFTQLKLIATIISTFYFSVMVGISLSILLHLEILLPTRLAFSQLVSKWQGGNNA